ncbi:unnamed protein product, partial [Prorocentrum cordatum]
GRGGGGGGGGAAAALPQEDLSALTSALEGLAPGARAASPEAAAAPVCDFEGALADLSSLLEGMAASRGAGDAQLEPDGFGGDLGDADFEEPLSELHSALKGMALSRAWSSVLPGRSGGWQARPHEAVLVASSPGVCPTGSMAQTVPVKEISEVSVVGKIKYFEDCAASQFVDKINEQAVNDGSSYMAKIIIPDHATDQNLLNHNPEKKSFNDSEDTDVGSADGHDAIAIDTNVNSQTLVDDSAHDTEPKLQAKPQELIIQAPMEIDNIKAEFQHIGIEAEMEAHAPA